MTPCPDLLEHEPSGAEPGPDLQQALTFAFTTGGAEAVFDRAVPRAEDGDPAWQAECFADELELSELVLRCLPLPKDAVRQGARPRRTAALVAVLSAPPRTREGVVFRQDIARELAAERKMRDAAVRVHGRIAEWRALLEASGGAQRIDPLRRRIEILYATRGLVDLVADSFAAAGSGLRRLSEWAESVRQAPAFGILCRLLADEAHLATVDVSVRLDRDGELRRYDIVRVAARNDNPFRVGPWGRLWSRVLLLVFGHRVRRDEVASRLVDSVFEGVQVEVSRFFQIQRDLDFFLGALAFRDLARARGLAVCLPDLDRDSSGARRIDDLFNPLLLGEERPPVPCEVDLPRGGIVIVTGPNSGGKTRFIEAIAMLQVLAHAGVWVPASRACVPWARGLFASLHQSDRLLPRAACEGGLGTELLRIKEIFERLETGGLVVVDELCSGTNPSEGEEIFEVVVDLLADMRVHAFITTHFLHFAARLEAARSESLSFLRVRLDAHEHPTYGFVPGVAKTSLARQTAERLGVTREELGALVAQKIRRAGEPDAAADPPRADLDARSGTS